MRPMKATAMRIQDVNSILKFIFEQYFKIESSQEMNKDWKSYSQGFKKPNKYLIINTR